MARGGRGVAEVGAQLPALAQADERRRPVQQRPRVRVGADPGDAEVGDGSPSPSRRGRRRGVWPAGAGRKPSGKPVEPPIVLSLLTAWNFRMQQVVLCGRTPQVSVRSVRLANAGPAGAPVARGHRRDHARLPVEHEERAVGRHGDVAVELRQQPHAHPHQVPPVDGERRVELVVSGVHTRRDVSCARCSRSRARSRSRCRSRSGRRRRRGRRRARRPRQRVSPIPDARGTISSRRTSMSVLLRSPSRS